MILSICVSFALGGFAGYHWLKRKLQSDQGPEWMQMVNVKKRINQIEGESLVKQTRKNFEKK